MNRYQLLPESTNLGLFLDAYSKRKAPLTLVIGSGLSAPAGLPTWKGLRKQFEDKIRIEEQTLNSFQEAFIGKSIQTLKKTTDPWVAFKLIREILSKPTFEALVEKFLTTEDSNDVPEGYRDVLRLEPRGVVTLNLDRLAGEAMGTIYGGSRLTPVYGKEIGRSWNALIADNPFLVYLHGNISDPSTWVLTIDDLDELSNTEGHKLFLSNTFASNIVLFVGVSADDVGLSRRLIELRADGFRPRNLYWLTTRHDEETVRWASDNYVKRIEYNARSNEEH